MAVVVASGLPCAGCDRVFDFELASPDAPVDTAPSGFDEDGDQIDDAFDACPGIPDPAQALDGDLDGLGDHCDPHPALPGDRLVRRYHFNDPALDPADWRPTTTWHFEAGAVVQAKVQTGTLIAIEEHLASASLTIEIGYRITAFGGSGNEAGISIDGLAHRCYVEDDVRDGRSQLWIRPAGGAPTFQIFDPEIAVGALLRMRLTRDASAGAAALRCTVATGKHTAAAAPDVRGELGVVSVFQPMRVEYVLVYDVAGG